MLYRIAATFGMPPARQTDDYKMCWAIDLKHHDGSIAQFGDYKGGLLINFDGSKSASTDWLELVNYLAGFNCLHTFDGIIAGTTA
jgi:hypothetical protein